MKRLLLFAAILGVAIYGLNSCTVYRGIAYGAPGIDDYRIFENDTIRKSSSPWHFEKGGDIKLDTTNWKSTKKGKIVAVAPIDSIMTYGKNTAFIIIRNDSVLLESYYMGRKREDVSTVYSVSKTLTCMLTEIAVDEGFIESIDDPVRKYFPKLGSKRDTMFNHLTIRHLMDMRAALKHNENYGVDPFSKLARLFYGRNAMGQLRKLKMTGAPGKKNDYQSVSTEVLGVVIERATGRPLAQYMQEKVWGPLGAEYNALLSLDSKRHRVPKAFGGFAVTAMDLAKIGRLYLNMGNWNGTQILDSAWVKIARTPKFDNDGYQLSWRSAIRRAKDSTGNNLFADSLSVVNAILAKGRNLAQSQIWEVKKDRNKENIGKWYGYTYLDSYYALGILQQVMLIDPKKNMILIRLGHDDNFANYTTILTDIATWL